MSAITVNPNVYYRQGNGNAIYSVSTTMQFNIITARTDNVTFNVTSFNVTSVGGVEVNITMHTFVNEREYSFTFNNTGTGILFNLSGLTPNQMYTIFHNRMPNNTTTADSNGFISFFERDDWNGTILLRYSIESLRITARRNVVDLISIANDILTVVGIVLIIGAIMVIVFIVKYY